MCNLIKELWDYLCNLMKENSHWSEQKPSSFQLTSSLISKNFPLAFGQTSVSRSPCGARELSKSSIIRRKRATAFSNAVVPGLVGISGIVSCIRPANWRIVFMVSLHGHAVGRSVIMMAWWFRWLGHNHHILQWNIQKGPDLPHQKIPSARQRPAFDLPSTEECKR